MREELEEMASEHEQFSLWYTLDRPSESETFENAFLCVAFLLSLIL